MEPLSLDIAWLTAFLDAAAQKLQGEWLLVGGAAAIARYGAARATEDIDLIGLGGTASERIALMDLAASLGLPVEAVNSTADYFVRRIPGWRDHLEVIRTGPAAVIYCPDPELFLRLKIARLSASDLGDCLALLAHLQRPERTVGPALDGAALVTAMDALPESDDVPLLERRRRLRDLLVTI